MKNLSNLSTTIKDCNSVLETLDGLEEQRPLYLQEYNFRLILKEHILKLLRYKKEYWKKRYTIRWIKFGDESTSFFHAAATERYRINIITSLVAEDGRDIFDHHEKAAILLEEYKGRMGCSTTPSMLYNLEQLVQRNDNMEHLSSPFTIEDIDKIVKQMQLTNLLALTGLMGSSSNPAGTL